MTSSPKGWLSANLEDPEFRRLLAREDFIEHFLHKIEHQMTLQGVTRAELARRMNCRPANITQLFKRTRNLTASSMVDIAFHLDLNLKLEIETKTMNEMTVPAWSGKAVAAAAQSMLSRLDVHGSIGREYSVETAWAESSPRTLAF